MNPIVPHQFAQIPSQMISSPQPMYSQVSQATGIPMVPGMQAMWSP
jgi:hypothetical protein